jgi:hypothetical protein
MLQPQRLRNATVSWLKDHQTSHDQQSQQERKEGEEGGMGAVMKGTPPYKVNCRNEKCVAATWNLNVLHAKFKFGLLCEAAVDIICVFILFLFKL